MIGMVFGNLSFWLWCLAALAFAFMLHGAYSMLSSLRGWRTRLITIAESSSSKHGVSELLREPPKKSMAMRVGKAMMLILLMFLAYDAGRSVSYSKAHAEWKARSVEYQRLYAAWAARQPNKENK